MGLAGAIIVVGPQDAAHLDARKVLSLLRDAGVRVLGAVENMRGLRCPHCGETLDVFPPVADERSLLREVELLVSIPLDPFFRQGQRNPIALPRARETRRGALHLGRRDLCRAPLA